MDKEKESDEELQEKRKEKELEIQRRKEQQAKGLEKKLKKQYEDEGTIKTEDKKVEYTAETIAKRLKEIVENRFKFILLKSFEKKNKELKNPPI